MGKRSSGSPESRSVSSQTTARESTDLYQVLLIVLFIIVGLIYDWGGVIGHPGPGLSNIRDGAFTGGFAGTAQSFTVGP